MSDLVSFIKNEYDAIWNTNNLEAVMQRFAEDAVVTTIPALPGAPATFSGKAEVRGFVQTLLVNFHVDSKNFAANGDKVTWFARVSSDSIRGMGVDGLDTNCEAIIQNNKVKSFLVTFTPETLANLAAAQKSR